MNSKNILTAIIIGLLFSCNATSQKNEQKKLFEKAADNFYKNIFDQVESIPGFYIVVVKGQETIYQKGFGYSDVEKQIKPNAQTNYNIASITKSFLGLLASILDAEGTIKLDDPITKYFPDTEFIEELEADKVLVRDLFTHTSGITNFPIGFRAVYPGIPDLETRIQLMKYSSPNGFGRGNFYYDNSGYNIYAIILEKVTGKSWKDWLEEKIFQPLSMDRTTAYVSEAEKENWPIALPYNGEGVNNIKELYLKKKDNTMQAAGGLLSTPEDMAKWLKVHIGNGTINGQNIFPKDLIVKNKSKIVPGLTVPNDFFKGSGYGMGWEVGLYQEQNTVWHYGGFVGFRNHISFMPEKQIGVIVMINDGVSGELLKDYFAAFAYDYLLQLDNNKSPKLTNTELRFRKLTDSIVLPRINRKKQRIARGNIRRSNRASLLTLPNQNYAGVYKNDQYGTMKVEVDNNELVIHYGNMYSTTTPYTRADLIRVELIPGRGQVIKLFVENKNVTSLGYSGIIFKKTG